MSFKLGGCFTLLVCFMASNSFFGRHPLVSGVLVLLVLLLAGAGIAYFKTDKGKELLPTLETTSLAINNISAGSMQARMEMDLRNRMPITLKVDSFSYQTRVDGALLARGSKDEATVMQKNGVSHLSIPVTVNLDKVKDKIKSSQRDCVDVQMAMTLYTRLPVAGPRQIPVSVTKRVYVPKLPKIEVADVDVTHLGLKNGEATVNFKVTNYNPFPFTISGVRYNFSVSDDMSVQGTEDKDVTFAKRGTTIMPVQVRFEPKAMPKMAFKTLFRAEKTPYKVDGVVTVAAGRHNPKPMAVNFQNTGTLKDLKEAAKALND